ncbi:MAG: sugar phosphate nucleotidyltransferase [Candidatus Heimdallarchaeota archaeon]
MITTAYILAAGKGTRLYPFSRVYPKSLLPLLNRPIIVHSIERLIKAGIINIGIIIPNESTQIISQVQGTFPDLDVTWIVQKIPLGTANAVIQIEKHLRDENFIVIAGDSLFSVSFLRALSKVHLDDQNWITLSLEKMNFELMRHSSTVDYRDGRVWGVREKPQTIDETLSDLNSAACYAFSQSIFPYLKRARKSKRNEYELTSVINEIIHGAHPVGGVETDRICHITTPFDLWWYNLQFLRTIKPRDPTGALIGKAVSMSGEVIINRSVIGDHVVIQEGCHQILDSVILSNSVLQRDHKNALVLRDFYQQFSQTQISERFL